MLGTDCTQLKWKRYSSGKNSLSLHQHGAMFLCVNLVSNKFLVGVNVRLRKRPTNTFCFHNSSRALKGLLVFQISIELIQSPCSVNGYHDWQLLETIMFHAC